MFWANERCRFPSKSGNNNTHIKNKVFTTKKEGRYESFYYLIDFAFKTTLPISIAAIIGMAIAHFFWQRYLDKKEHISHEVLDVSEITTTAPAFYAILPFTPIIGVLIFDGKWGPQLRTRST